MLLYAPRISSRHTLQKGLCNAERQPVLDQDAFVEDDEAPQVLPFRKLRSISALAIFEKVKRVGVPEAEPIAVLFFFAEFIRLLCFGLSVLLGLRLFASRRIVASKSDRFCSWLR